MNLRTYTGLPTSEHRLRARRAFSLRLAELLQQKKMSPYRLAKLSKMSLESIRGYLDAAHMPGKRSQHRLAGALETDIADLFRSPQNGIGADHVAVYTPPPPNNEEAEQVDQADHIRGVSDSDVLYTVGRIAQHIREGELTPEVRQVIKILIG